MVADCYCHYFRDYFFIILQDAVVTWNTEFTFTNETAQRSVAMLIEVDKRITGGLTVAIVTIDLQQSIASAPCRHDDWEIEP